MKALAIFAFLLGVIALAQPWQRAASDLGAARAVAANYVAYRNAANSYALASSPATFPDPIPGLPAGWRAVRHWQAVLNGGSCYVFGPASSEEIEAILGVLRHSRAVGVKEGGRLWTGGISGPALPNFIPSGNVVSVIRING